MKYLIFILFFSIFNIPEKIEKKIDKEILIIFDSDVYSKELISIEEEIEKSLPLRFNNGNFYKIIIDENLVGYFYYGQAPTKTDVFDYVVIFDENMIIKKIKVLIYREDYGGEISSKRWLKQFNKLTMNDSVTYRKEIKGISGATISARSMTITINKLLQSLTIIQNNNQL